MYQHHRRDGDDDIPDYEMQLSEVRPTGEQFWTSQPYLNSEFTLGADDQFVKTRRFYNLLGRPVTIVTRDGMRTSIKDIRHTPYISDDLFNHRSRFDKTNTTKPYILTVEDTYKMNVKALEEFEKFYFSLSDEERKQRRYQDFYLGVRTMHEHRLSSDHYQGGPTSPRLNKNIEYIHVVRSADITVEMLERKKTIYLKDYDILISILPVDDKSLIHPHDSFIDYTVRHQEQKKRILPGIVLIDKTKSVPYLFTRNNNVLTRIENQAHLPEYKHLADGVYLTISRFDPKKPHLGNITEHIVLDITNTEQLEKYNLFYTYQEAELSDKARQDYIKSQTEQETIYFKNEQAKTEASSKNSEQKFKTFVKVLGYVSSIASAILPFVFKFMTQKAAAKKT